MRKITVSIVALLAMSTMTYAGGDIAPVEPMVEVPVEEVATPSPFYIGLAYSYFDASYGSSDVTADGMLGLVGYNINDYFAIEGRYTGTLSDLTVDDGMGKIDRDKSITNAALYLKAIYPVDNFAVYGLLGYGSTSANNDSDGAFQYGVGLSYDLNDKFAVFVDWTNLYDDSGLNYIGDTSDYTIDTWNFGVTYNF